MILARDMTKSTTLPETPKTTTSQPKSPFPDSEVEGHIRLDIAKKEKKKKKKSKHLGDTKKTNPASVRDLFPSTLF